MCNPTNCAKSMIYLAYFIMGFTVVQLLVAFTNLLWGRFGYKGQNMGNHIVSVLIPARNEANNIGNLLDDLQKQHYTNLEILVFDDQSTDNTASIVATAAQNDKRIKLLQSGGLPNGWFGKNHACHQLANQASGKYYLFLDADVRVDANIVSNAVQYMHEYKPAMFSIFPKQLMFTSGEWSTVPVMNYILLTLLPLVLVLKSGFTSFSAANGQFMFFDAVVYRKYWLHEKFKSCKAEDIAISRYLKRQGLKIACFAADESVYCRMYQSFGEAINGFSKNVTHFFGNSFVLAILFWLITTLGFILVLMLLTVYWFVLYVIIVLVTRMVVSITSGQSIIKNLIFLIPQHFAFCLFIYKAFNNKQIIWKGRNIS